ncbi:MAG: AAA family ATPase [Candidatus Hydrogenedentes bacterium]|nr:AAA family ATPase [Candidatus Hydrogenedentota bacterium]
MTEEKESVLAFFGLREHPFAATADPSYFYATRAHKECLFRVWNSVDSRHGIAVVLGHYGTGKTTLLRKLLYGMAARPERYNTAVLDAPIPSWTSFAFLQNIVEHLGLRPQRISFMAYLETINQCLRDRRHLVNTLIIDDAQNLNKRGQVELLRLLQNLETPQHRLLNLVLFAQLEWLPIIRAVPNFEQRINLMYTLRPFTFEETKELIRFRLQCAGANADRPGFDDEALRLIHGFSQGNPRDAVTLCRNALVGAAALRIHRISGDIIVHTVDRSTAPDDERRTLIASTLGLRESLPAMPSAGTDLLFEASPPSKVAAPESRRPDHEERANRLLLRAVSAPNQADATPAAGPTLPGPAESDRLVQTEDQPTAYGLQPTASRLQQMDDELQRRLDMDERLQSGIPEAQRGIHFDAIEASVVSRADDAPLPPLGPISNLAEAEALLEVLEAQPRDQSNAEESLLDDDEPTEPGY